MKYTAAIIALASVAAAQTNVTYTCAPDSASDCSPVTVSSSAAAAAATGTSKAACDATFNACSTAADANHASCVAAYAGCLGYNPFAANSQTNGTSASYVATTTEVVTALTTFCPAATVLTVNNKVYTVSSATTLTITDCPCTITKPVSSATWTASTVPANNGTATTSKPAIYTGGAAAQFGAGSGLMAAVAGVAMLI